MPLPGNRAPLIPMGFAVFNRRAMQLASRVKCGWAQFLKKKTFFWYFRKNLRVLATRKKENSNSGLYCKVAKHLHAQSVSLLMFWYFSDGGTACLVMTPTQ